jgi:hypothetical protein
MIWEKTQWLAIIAKSILEYVSRYLNGIYKIYLNINRKKLFDVQINFKLLFIIELCESCYNGCFNELYIKIVKEKKRSHHLVL